MTWLARRAGRSPADLAGRPDEVLSALHQAVKDTLDLAARSMAPDVAVREAAREEAVAWQQELDETRADATPYLGRLAAGLRDAAEQLRVSPRSPGSTDE
jgi:hypothetical protein